MENTGYVGRPTLAINFVDFLSVYRHYLKNSLTVRTVGTNVLNRSYYFRPGGLQIGGFYYTTITNALQFKKCDWLATGMAFAYF